MRRASLGVGLAAVVVLGGCVRHAAKIPAKAALDMECAPEQLTVLELGGGDTGSHLVTGCGKKATYEMNPLGDWVLNGPVTRDPKFITPEQGEQK